MSRFRSMQHSNYTMYISYFMGLSDHTNSYSRAISALSLCIMMSQVDTNKTTYYYACAIHTRLVALVLAACVEGLPEGKSCVEM